MGYDWSAIRINKLAGSLYAINDDIVIYVAPNGNDIDGDGSAGNPYARPHRAFEYLDDKTIGQAGSVTIKCAAGEYNNFPPLYPKHQNGDKIYIVGEEPEVYRIKGCRTFDYEGVTAESNIHQMGLIVATADVNHEGDHAGWTSEHGLTQGDVNSSYMLIFNTSIYADGYNDSFYPFAKDAFFGSLLDNRTETGQFNWGNGNATRYGLQWTKLVGINKIVGVTGAKAREAGGVENAVSDGVDKNCGITIEKYQASTRWSVNDVWGSRDGPDRTRRSYYNDWREKSNAPDGGDNGRIFISGGNIGVVAEFGGATNAGHTAGFIGYSTPTTLEGRVLRTVFNCSSSGLVLEDGHKLGGISNIAFVARNSNVALTVSTNGITVRTGSCLGASGASWPTYPTKNIGILGFAYGVNVNTGSQLYSTQIAVSASRFTDGDSPFNHQGYYGFSINSDSYAQCPHSVCFGCRAGFQCGGDSYFNCDCSVASSHISKGGWLGFDPGAGLDFVDTFRMGYYIYQKVGENGEFWGRITGTNATTYRVSYQALYGEPKTDHAAGSVDHNFFIDADLDVAKSQTGTHAIVAATEALPSVYTTFGRGFTVNQGNLACTYSIATGLADGFVASIGSSLVCSKCTAHECFIYGIRGWLSDNVTCIDSCASRCYVGYVNSGGTMYSPYTWAINNIRWNYYSVNGRSAFSKSISFEGFDASIESHSRWDGPGSHSYNFFDENSQYNISDNLHSAIHRGTDSANPQHPITHTANLGGTDNIPRGYYPGGGEGVDSAPVYLGAWKDVEAVTIAYDNAGDASGNPRDNFYENRKQHGTTGVPGQIDRIS